MKRAEDLHIIDVYHVDEDGLHEFASPQMRQFYINTKEGGLDQILDRMPEFISAFIKADTGAVVSVQAMPTYKAGGQTFGTRQPTVRHYAVKTRGKGAARPDASTRS